MSVIDLEARREPPQDDKLQKLDLLRRDVKKMARLIGRAEEGDKKAMAKLLPIFQEFPEFWGIYDFADRAQRIWIERIASVDLVLAEALKHEAPRLRQELGGEHPEPLEALLVERIVACRFQVLYADCVTARDNNLTIKQAEFQQRRQERAERRLLSAIRALAQVRRFLVPAVQVNVAERQVNVAQLVTPTPGAPALPESGLSAPEALPGSG